MAIYAADFETTTKKSDCRVWAWGIADIREPDAVCFGTDIDGALSYMQNNGGIYYFHNLKFDGNFILYYLFKSGYKWVNDRRHMDIGTFTTMISDMGAWYTITIQFKPTETGVSEKVEIRDSYKIIPMSIEDIPSSFGLEEHKGELDYTAEREIGHKLTEDEKTYLSGDVIILAKAVSFMISHGMKKLTTGSNALKDFKSRYTSKEYNRLFPKLDPRVDSDIRLSYKGGWTYLNPVYKNKTVSEGCVYDVNSMYPWAMKHCLLPYGEPYFFTGEYKPNVNYPLYVINFVATFKLKPGAYPSIQLKHSMWYSDNEYIEASLAPTVLTLTSVDYELFLHNYDVHIIEFFGGYMFKAQIGMFDSYIDYWYNEKNEARAEHNKGREKIAKLMLNALYGKFGARLKGYSKEPYYDSDADIVRYKKTDEEERTGGYLPIATFITSYCRDKIIRAAEVCEDRFVYADTDSVHIVGIDPVPGMDVDLYRLGAFKLETQFKRAKFIRQKTYLEIYDRNGIEEMNLKCAGMPDKLKNSVTEDDFYEGAIFDPNDKEHNFNPKLLPKIVPGGVILTEVTFQIRETKHQEINIDIEEEFNVQPKKVHKLFK